PPKIIPKIIPKSWTGTESGYLHLERLSPFCSSFDSTCPLLSSWNQLFFCRHHHHFGAQFYHHHLFPLLSSSKIFDCCWYLWYQRSTGFKRLKRKKKSID